MSEFKDALQKIATENGITLTESNPFGLSDEEYARQLAMSREEDREENAALYDRGFGYFVKPVTNIEVKEKPKKPRKKTSMEDILFKRYQKKLLDKKNELSSAFGRSDINQLAAELASIKKSLYKKAKQYPNLYKLLGEETLDEGDKKIFDKETGYNVSADEDFYYEFLKKKWPDIERSKTFEDFRNPENHRPWQVDFYVPSENMMIQINKNWRHGRRPYNPEDPDCQSDVEWLKSQEGDYYKKVLYTWTELEPLKRKIAKELGYKYVEIFNMDEFMDWYKNPELTYEEYKHPTKLEYDSDEYFAQKARGRDIYGNDSQPYAP